MYIYITYKAYIRSDASCPKNCAGRYMRRGPGLLCKTRGSGWLLGCFPLRSAGKGRGLSGAVTTVANSEKSDEGVSAKSSTCIHVYSVYLYIYTHFTVVYTIPNYSIAHCNLRYNNTA